jgi:curved DNA-binding protein CbpA
MTVKELYACLELDETASEEDIKRQYRALALKYHPDKNPDDAEAATRRFQKISHAYSILGDPKKRRDYDRQGDEDDCYHRRAHFDQSDAEFFFDLFFQMATRGDFMFGGARHGPRSSHRYFEDDDYVYLGFRGERAKSPSPPTPRVDLCAAYRADVGGSGERRMCGKCKSVFYCNQICQKNVFRNHKKLC